MHILIDIFGFFKTKKKLRNVRDYDLQLIIGYNGQEKIKITCQLGTIRHRLACSVGFITEPSVSSPPKTVTIAQLSSLHAK
jgi:hypothetical protein